ncbi:hypothetical protein AJGP001_13415 [Planococcus faecalis]|uniref:SEC-C domain-containing protein n=1 Tax=Planococcus faecalis TaxID=1598147 RepID=A0ABN4XN65_9BACL|nr:SEC-C metal-binding domain-containing protein [Planococcus faecalis]AQU80211.1 hypothetical protein AJGP001_13415 [Planococcus faecalis]
MDSKTWVDYISAMVNLYGIVPFEQVAKVISSQNKESIAAEEIKAWIQDPFAGGLAKAALQNRFVYEYGGGFFVGEWIMEFEAFDEHWLAQQGKPYYVPEREELLKWSDPDYFEKPTEFFNLQQYMVTLFPEAASDKVEGAAEDLQMMAEDPFSLERIIREFDRMGLKLEESGQLKKVAELVMDMHNHTRLQINRGYTPHELFQEEKKSLLSLSEKIGRNDPCLCGSGKKYKKCCGKVA